MAKTMHFGYQLIDIYGIHLLYTESQKRPLTIRMPPAVRVHGSIVICQYPDAFRAQPGTITNLESPRKCETADTYLDRFLLCRYVFASY